MLGEGAAVLDHLDAGGEKLVGDGVVAYAQLQPHQARPRLHGQDVVEVRTLSESAFGPSVIFSTGQSIQSTTFPELNFPVVELFRD